MVHDPPGASVQNRNWPPAHPVAVYVMLLPAACGDAVAVEREAAVHVAPVSVYVPSQYASYGAAEPTE
jgi:hypothetical protein